MLRRQQQRLLQRAEQQQRGGESPPSEDSSAEAAMAAAAAAAARAHRLEEALADIEALYKDSEVNMERQRQQIVQAQKIVEQQTSASMLQERAEALQTQLAVWVCFYYRIVQKQHTG